jgi:hypothetical protein
MDRKLLDEIYAQFRSYDEIHEQDYGVGDILISLFKDDSDVETIYSYKDDDYSGEAFVVYKYKEKYFYLQEYFGSCDGCDNWMNSRTLDSFKQGIENSICDHIHEITYPFEDEYCNPQIYCDWTRILRDRSEECYQRCFALAEARKKQKEVEREMKKTEYEKQKEQHLIERQRKEKEDAFRKRLQEDQEFITDMEDTISYLQQKNSDNNPYYGSVLPNKLRMHKYYNCKIHGVHELFKDKKQDLIQRASCLDVNSK